MPNANGRDGAVVVSFDLDGVIMQNPFDKGVTPHILGCLRASRDLLGLPVEEADRRGRTAIREAWGRRAASGEFVSCYDWDGIYEEVSRGFGGAPTPDVSELVRAYCEVDGMISLLPRAHSGLERLRAAGLRVVAITNGYHAYQWPVLQSLGVAEYFESVVTPEAAGFAKPDPRLFESVLGLAAHVGDNLIHDVLGANLAGLRSVWLREGLPVEVARLPTSERASSSALRDHARLALETSPYVQYHPEAVLESSLPDAVVLDADEAADVLLQWYG